MTDFFGGKYLQLHFSNLPLGDNKLFFLCLLEKDSFCVWLVVFSLYSVFRLSISKYFFANKRWTIRFCHFPNSENSWFFMPVCQCIWPNISAKNPDPVSGWKILSLNRDHFWLDFCNSQWSWMRFRDWILIMYVLHHVHYVPYYLWRKSRSTRSIPFEP